VKGDGRSFSWGGGGTQTKIGEGKIKYKTPGPVKPVILKSMYRKKSPRTGPGLISMRVVGGRNA